MRTGRDVTVGMWVVALGLAACAGVPPVPTPADFPLHATDQQFDLSWRLAPGADLTKVTGLVGRRTRDVSDARLQLVGLDAAGRIVSFSELTHVRWASPWNTESFTLALRPLSPEQRFEVRVTSFLYLEGAPTKG